MFVHRPNRKQPCEARIAAARAFTLIELMLVVAIAGVVAAMVVPRFVTATDRYRADTAARRIAGDLRHAQTRARLASSARTVKFDPPGGSYTISDERDTDRPSRPYVVSLGGQPYSATLVSAAFGGSSTISFNGYGFSATGGEVVVRVGTWQKTVVIAAGSGEISIR